MEEFDVKVAIYLVNGFLESGKTSFLNYTIRQSYFFQDEPSLLIACEDGEEEYNDEELKGFKTYVERVEKLEDITKEWLLSLEEKYHMDRIMLEYNPLWGTEKLEALELPEEWGIIQRIVTVDTSTFQVYMNNMKSIFVEMIRKADLVIFNRAEMSMPLSNFRRSVKVVNPAAMVVFENEEGELPEIEDEELPYDIDAEVIEIGDIDYGVFFIDLQEHPEKYTGKTVCFTGHVLKTRELGKGFFIPGRHAMTCCADDTTFIGYACKSKNAEKLAQGSWIQLTATVEYGYLDAYKGEGPIFQAKSIKPHKRPEVELVYFN